MAISKTSVVEALNKIKATKGNAYLVDAGHVKNIQIFGDEVVVDVISESPALHIKKKAGG